MKLQSVGNNNQKQVLILKPNTFKGNKIKPKKNDFVSLASVCKPQNYSYGPFKHIASSNNRHILKATSIVGELISAMDKFTGKVLKRVEIEAPKKGVACYADYFYHGKQLGRLSWWSEDVIKEVKSLFSHPDFGQYPSFDYVLAEAAYLKIKEPKQFERLEKLFKLAKLPIIGGGYRTYFRAAKVKDESVFAKILKIAPDTKNKIKEKSRAAVDEIEKILAEYEASLKN